MPTQPPTHPPGLAQRRATRLAFFIAGAGMSGWAPLVPYAKARAGLDDAVLGMLLLCLAVGSLLTMPLTGVLVARYGCRRVILAGSLLLAAPLPLLATLSSLPALALSLLVFGAGLGCLDVAMNLQAVILERAGGRPMMSGFHARFSLGGIAGAGGMAALLALGFSPVVASLVLVGVIAAVAIAAAPNLLSEPTPPGPGGRPANNFAIPHGRVILLGTLCGIAFLAEGAVFDWSAVFLTAARAMPTAQAGLGYAAFSLTMTLGRLGGDRLVRRHGTHATVVASALAAAGGILLVILVPAWPAAILGYAIVGAGCANIAPVLFTLAGKSAMPDAAAIPAMMTMGYAGLLVGPTAIGWIAHATSLATAFLLVALLLIATALAGRRL